MTMVIPTKIEKCKGAMLATAIGDALGWPNELPYKNRTKKPKVVDHFVEWTRSSKEPRWHNEKIMPGEYSDDTQMTLAVARSIIAGDWEKFLAEKELPFWLKYERGGGRALLKAAKSISEKKVQLWQSDYTQGYFNAGGNGAAMRILPHVIAAAKSPNITTLMLDVIKDTLITHGHPRAFLGATCYAYALDYLLKKETVLEYGELVAAVIEGQKDWGAPLSPDVFGNWLDAAGQHREYDFLTEWENTRAHMLHQLEFIKASLKNGLIIDDTKVLTELECFGKVNGAGDVAALAAIYLASRYANNPTLGIKVPAFSFGADTDTLASITGGLVGMLSGMNWIPIEWKAVQDYDCLIQITELLLADNKKEATKAKVKKAEVQDSGWVSTLIGKMRVVDTKSVPNGKYGFVIIKKWRTALGQTLYTKEFQPIDNRPPQSRQTDGQLQMLQRSALYDLAEQPKSVAQQQVPVPEKATAQDFAQKTAALKTSKRRFTLDSEDVAVLIENPQFNNKITVGKVLNIIQALTEDVNTDEAIAKQFNVEQMMVDLIAKYVQ